MDENKIDITADQYHAALDKLWDAVGGSENGIDDVFTLVSNRIKELEKINIFLIKDKARLDWLADKNNNIGNVQLPSECVENNLTSLRDAIDAAMLLER